MPDLMIVRTGILPLAFPEHHLLAWNLRRSKTVLGKNPSNKMCCSLSARCTIRGSARRSRADCPDSFVRKRFSQPCRFHCVTAVARKTGPLVETLRKAFGRSRAADSCGRVRAITIR